MHDGDMTRWAAKADKAKFEPVIRMPAISSQETGKAYWAALRI